jgi:two-component system sensor histidine kinase/response regulator
MTDRTCPAEEALGRTLSAELLHDLRTSLNQILGYSEMLTEQALEEGQTGFVPDLQKIQAAGRQLLALLNGTVPSLAANASQAEGRDAVAAMPALLQGESKTDTPAETPVLPAHQEAILVVDDSPLNRDLLARRLKQQGYRVEQAAGGRAAVDAVRAQAFDLVLLDIMMPEMDGYAVLEQFKADEELRFVPVIVISALDEQESVARCIEMGAEDYLPKPSHPTLFKARIGACLEKQRAHERERRLLDRLQQSHQRM